MRWDAEKYDAAKAPQVDAGRELIDLAKICESDSILDIGCGTGKLTVELVREDFSKKNILTAELNKRIAGSIRYSIKGGIH